MRGICLQETRTGSDVIERMNIDEELVYIGPETKDEEMIKKYKESKGKTESGVGIMMKKMDEPRKIEEKNDYLVVQDKYGTGYITLYNHPTDVEEVKRIRREEL